MKLKQTENEVKRDIENYMAITHIIGWRQNSGAFIGEHKDKTRFFRFLRWVWPKCDQLVFLDYAGIKNGIYWTCEVKAIGKKPSQNQQYTIDFWNDNGCSAFYADSLDMFIEKWENEEEISREYVSGKD